MKPPSPTPSQDIQERLIKACRHLDDNGDLSLVDLSGKVGLSPSHLQRVFTHWIGLSPKRYAVARRDAKVRRLLSLGIGISQAFHDAGYETPSRFYEGIWSRLGMLPSQYRKGGDGVKVRVSVGTCSLGDFLVGIGEGGVCAIDLGDDAQVLMESFLLRFPRATINPASVEDDDLVAKVVELLDGARSHALPLDIQGTVFQKQVWQALTNIPRGKTATYADIAKAIGRPAAHRAVARACASNCIAVAIPCHRVVRTDGSLSGYRWGVQRKEVLLARERPG